ncbi:MAG TPA: hypothetical protein VE710_08465 [Candidatus Bathyarchaeia archaeon]|nr:hypothetical protein [Candidatus Bathyarchaeia archaeon]
MKIAIYQIAHRLGLHPKDVAKMVYDGDVTGEVPGGDAQSKDAWVDLLSLRNYIDWLNDQGRMEALRYQKSIRHIDTHINQIKRK